MERLRNYFRRRMPFMTPEQAHAAKAKLSLVYAVLAWNIIGATVYIMFKDQIPKTPTSSTEYAKLLGIKNASVIQYSGFRKVATYDITLKDEEIEEFHTKPTKAAEEKSS